ncbi:MAG: ribonuclease P protein component [Rikenellaceae bacterium]|nr:ribonuclease P protein component [Rikenellaceae bacterium]
MDCRFPKIERIRLKRDIDALFARGGSFFSFPFKCVYLVNEPADGVPPLRMLVSVSKRYSKRAVHRNLIKRRTREAFRLCKGRFVTDAMRHVDIAFIYVSKKEESYDTIFRSVERILAQICAEAQR